MFIYLSANYYTFVKKPQNYLTTWRSLNVFKDIGYKLVAIVVEKNH